MSRNNAIKNGFLKKLNTLNSIFVNNIATGDDGQHSNALCLVFVLLELWALIPACCITMSRGEGKSEILFTALLLALLLVVLMPDCGLMGSSTSIVKKI